jgi:Galactosyltransferase
MSFFILLCTCGKNADRWEKIQSEWLSVSGIEYAFVVGNPTLANEYEWDSSSRVLRVRCEDDYEGLSFKIHCGIRAIKELFNPDGILKIDDDVWVDLDLLHAFLKNVEHDYYGKINYFTVFIPVQSVGGPVYFISRRAIDILSTYMKPETMRYEDVCVAMTLHAHGILPVSVPHMYTDTNEPGCIGYHGSY